MWLQILSINLVPQTDLSNHIRDESLECKITTIFDIHKKIAIFLFIDFTSTYSFVQLKEESVWLTQEQIATLFGTQRPAITKHLNNIFNSGELDRTSTCSILEHMGNDGKTTLCN